MTTPWLVSFHGGHSGAFCNHAHGTLEEIVQSAISQGFAALGVSEHMPRFRDQDLAEDEIEAGLTPNDLVAMFENYSVEFDRIQARYGHQIPLLKGMECEVVPPQRYAEEVAFLRDRHHLDYLVGSVHYVREVLIDMNEASWQQAADTCGSVLRLVEDYFDTVVTMIETLRPEVVGHLDLIKIFAPEPLESPTFRRGVERSLEAARAVGSVIEVNGRALKKGLSEPYPGRNILESARAIGVEVTLGDDSHGPDEVGGHLRQCRQTLIASGHDRLTLLRRTEKGGVDRTPIPLA